MVSLRIGVSCSAVSRLGLREGTMRLVAAVAGLLALLLTIGASGAHAEKQTDKLAERHIFVIANDADAYCHSHEYAQALSFRKAEPDDIAGTISDSRSDDRSCSGSRCGEFVAIECSR